MICKICDNKTDGVRTYYKKYVFPNKSLCSSCDYSIHIFRVDRLRSTFELLRAKRLSQLSKLSDEEFFNNITKRILNNEEVKI